ncbi:cytochrome c [Deinococcus sp. RIT780]|uniref:c-type cytochrome n=1 Tax=Deinococcus sp. RIT780 TaxID=2870472 RepID=UPI001C8AB28B|nr:cytochrome c [Deinococcus sp. RIT780]MBX8465509.1 c-type cytochrome [Deinococcus sp. RIT780]
MKNTFAVSMTLLLALTLGGSFTAYRAATSAHHEETHSKDEGHSEGGEKEGASRPSESAPSPDSAATGAAGEAGALGDVEADNEGGVQAGENGAVQDTGEDTTGSTPAASQDGTATDTDPAGATGQEPDETAAAAETQGDSTAGGDSYATSCAGCHGAEGQGGIGPALEKVNEWTLAQFTTVLREGKTPERELGAVMPRFTDAQLTDSDVANVYAFIKTLY